MSGVLLGLAVLAVPQPTNAVAGETFYIAADATPAASVGAGTSCTDADVEYDPLTGLEAALAAIYEDTDFDSGDEIVLCDVDATDGNVDYVMLGDVEFDDGNFDNDNDDATLTAVTLDLSDAAAPGSVTIRGDADDANSIVIDANDGVGGDTGGYSPFDFTDANVTIEFLTILNAWDDSAGGAIHVMEVDSTNGLTLTLNSVVIEYAYAQGGDGAGAYVEGDVVITDSVFEDNATGGAPAGAGGAVYATGDVTITDSEFTDNSADLYGGAVFAVGSVNVSSSTFSGNEAADGGGAIFLVDGDNASEISGSTFEGNSAGAEWGGAIIAAAGGSLLITDSSFRENSAGYGGAIDQNATDFSLRRVSFVKNTATEGGGALAIGTPSRSSDLVGLSFRGNRAPTRGGRDVMLYNNDSTDRRMNANKRVWVREGVRRGSVMFVNVDRNPAF
jgi:predicted outer membrane repeat protein